MRLCQTIDHVTLKNFVNVTHVTIVVYVRYMLHSYVLYKDTKDTQRNLGNLIIYKDTQRYPEKPGEVKDALRRLNLPRDA